MTRSNLIAIVLTASALSLAAPSIASAETIGGGFTTTESSDSGETIGGGITTPTTSNETIGGGFTGWLYNLFQ